MANSGQTICITCGNGIEDALRFNLLPSGELCPTCRDRVLDALPPLLPSTAQPVEAQPEASALETDSHSDDPIGA